MKILTCNNCGLGEVSIIENDKHFCSEKCLIEYKTKYGKKYKIDLDMDEIKRLYVDEQMSTLQIAKQMGTYKKMILTRLKDMNVKTRTSGESKSLYLLNNPKENPFAKEDVKKKIKKNNLEKYGVEHNSQTEEYKELYKKTSLEKYGVEHPLKSKEIRDKIDIKRKQNFYKQLIKSNRLKNKVVPMFSKDEYINITKKYKWKCITCGNVFQDHLDDGHIPRCFICFPRQLKTSSYENEIVDWLKSLSIQNIIQGDNSFIENKKSEIDIYLPDYKLAIEFDGLYWHSESNGKDKNYHLNKTIECEKQGIQLIHIFEDEWVNKQEIIKNIISTKLNKSNIKIYARKCIIKELESKNTKDLLKLSHIQGYIPAKINIGLYYQDELISLLTFGKSRFNKKYDWEILRFVNKQGYSITGGFAKMLKYFTNNYSGNIITYSDRRLFNGSIYENNGFTKLKPSKPSYHYTKGLDRQSRQKFMKYKLHNQLEHFNSEFTEIENMRANGYDRIWDCGNNVFELN